MPSSPCITELCALEQSGVGYNSLSQYESNIRIRLLDIFGSSCLLLKLVFDCFKEFHNINYHSDLAIHWLITKLEQF